MELVEKRCCRWGRIRYLGDTIGVAPLDKSKKCCGARPFVIAIARTALSPTPTAPALTNVLVGLQMGITTIDSALGFGCPMHRALAVTSATEV